MCFIFLFFYFFLGGRGGGGGRRKSGVQRELNPSPSAQYADALPSEPRIPSSGSRRFLSFYVQVLYMWWIYCSWTLWIVLEISVKEVSECLWYLRISMNCPTLTEAFHRKTAALCYDLCVAPTHFLLFCWSWYKCLCLVWVGFKRSVVDSELSPSCLFQNSEGSLNSVAHSSLCCKHKRQMKLSWCPATR